MVREPNCVGKEYIDGKGADSGGDMLTCRCCLPTHTLLGVLERKIVRGQRYMVVIGELDVSGHAIIARRIHRTRGSE